MVFPFSKVIDYAAHTGDVNNAFFKFFNNLPPKDPQPEMEGLFFEWLIFDYKRQNRTTFLVEYILKNPDKLSGEDLNILKQIAQTEKYSMYDICEVVRGEFIILEDIFTGKKYRVYEKSGSLNIPKHGTLPGRIAKVNNKWYLVGANSVYFPIVHTDRMKKMLRLSHVGKYSPMNTVELLRSHEDKPTQPPIYTDKQIINKRKGIERDYIKAALKYNINLTFTNLINLIYNENRVSVLDFWKSLLRKGLTKEFLVDKGQILQDAWNYFPHKCIGGLAPIEAYSKMKKGE